LAIKISRDPAQGRGLSDLAGTTKKRGRQVDLVGSYRPLKAAMKCNNIIRFNRIRAVHA